MIKSMASMNQTYIIFMEKQLSVIDKQIYFSYYVLQDICKQ